MPTTKPRHAITETPGISHALEVARRRWPDEPASRLLTRLIEQGASAVERESEAADDEHERAIDALTELAACYPDDYLEDVRDGWPE